MSSKSLNDDGVDRPNQPEPPGSFYQIRLLGRLDHSWSCWFEEMAIRHVEGDGSGETILTGRFIDQAALRGTLTKLWDLRLTLISVIRFEDYLVLRNDSASGSHITSEFSVSTGDDQDEPSDSVL
jgi:hypothetical protein